MNNKIRIKLVKPCSSKLNIVKLIHKCSLLGLVGSKDFYDHLEANPGVSYEFDVRTGEAFGRDFRTGIYKHMAGDGTSFRDYFINEIKNLDGEYVINGGAQWERNLKMLKLGIGEIEDYRDFISEEIMMKSDNSSELINFILSKLSREELEETFNKFTQEI
jgi:hypothetical protein